APAFASIRAARRSNRRLKSAQHTEEIANVRDDGLWFFPGREVSAAGVMPPLLEVVVALGPAARGAAYFLRQHRNADGSLDHGHAVMHRRPGMVRSLVVVARRRAVALRDPVDHDRGQQIVLAKAGFNVAVAIAPAALLFEYPLKLASPIAVKTVVEFLRRGQHNLDEVRL